jgi:hypothetical protein
LYDLETVRYDASPQGSQVTNQQFLQSLDRWYGVTCSDENYFNEEVRGSEGGFAFQAFVRAGGGRRRCVVASIDST